MIFLVAESDEAEACRNGDLLEDPALEIVVFGEESEFEELADFAVSTGNRVDVDDATEIDLILNFLGEPFSDEFVRFLSLDSACVLGVEGEEKLSS